jgi:hypothetical protein
MTNPATETKSMWAAGRRAGALFFARHRDYFIVTRNFTAIYRDLVLSSSFTVTRNFLPSTGTGKKRGTATQTAPNQTAGPLYLSNRQPDLRLICSEYLSKHKNIFENMGNIIKR